MSELTTREAAALLEVNQSRVRALVASGALTGRRVGSQWLVDADSIDHRRELTSAGTTGRQMAGRVAWAAADLIDGGRASWLSADDRYRLRKRLHGAASVDVLRHWLANRAAQVTRYRVGEHDLDGLLAGDGVVRTGISAARAYRLGLGTGGGGEAYVTADIADALVREFFLIEARTGNLSLRILDSDLHQAGARRIDGDLVCPRLIVGADLADDRDSRTRAAGRDLLSALLDEQRDA